MLSRRQRNETLPVLVHASLDLAALNIVDDYIMLKLAIAPVESPCSSRALAQDNDFHLFWFGQVVSGSLPEFHSEARSRI
jgi:hypothetical protein